MDDLTAKIQQYSQKDLIQRKTWYSDAAKDYDRTRPRYSQETIDRLIDLISPSSNSRILEIGCGPATATRSFAKLNYPMLCLEPNPDMYRLAKQNCQSHANVEVINISLEEWQLEPSRFDIALSATAFHWIPADIGYPKVAAALKENGYFILLWNGQLLPKSYISKELEEVYQKYAPSLPIGEDIPTQKESLYLLGKMLQESELFAHPIYEEIVINTTYTIADYIALLSTYSPYIALDKERRDRLFSELTEKLDRLCSNSLELSYVSAFHLARKLS